MRTAERIFLFSGLYGLLLMPLMYFLERRVGETSPSPIRHPEFYYGFIGVALAWQVAFLIIASDARRYRPLMIPAMLEKFLFVAAIAVLYATGRGGELAQGMVFGAAIDLVLGLLFVVAWVKSRDTD